jgi:hypothetical protein
MALSDAEKASCRMYLGYPDLNRYKNPRLESIFVDGVLSLEAEGLIRTALTNLATVETKILSRLGVAGIKRADEVEFFKSAVYTEMRNWGRMYVSRISVTTGVPIYSDIFSTSGYLGDKYSAGGLGSSYHSNLIPLG